MSSLQSTMGMRYTAIVKKLLAAGNSSNDVFANEHESALDLEMTARDVVRAIAEAV